MRSLDIDVGVVPAAVQRGQMLVKVHFHGFADLDSAKDHAIVSHKFNCFNHDWVVRLFPGGDSGAPELARLCEDADETTPISIPDVKPTIFKGLLRYVYGGEVYPDWKKDAKKYMDAADKYGIPGLKVTAESWYVTYGNLTVLYADGKKCPLLREAAMKFIMENAKEVIESTPFEDVLNTTNIMKEIMLGMAAAGSGVGDKRKSEEMMSVNELRMALQEKGLDIDGPREMLVSRIKK